LYNKKNKFDTESNICISFVVSYAGCALVYSIHRVVLVTSPTSHVCPVIHAMDVNIIFTIYHVKLL